LKIILNSLCDPKFESQYNQIALTAENIDIETGLSIIDPQEPHNIGTSQLKIIFEK